MARRSPDPFKAMFKIAKTVVKVSKAMDRAAKQSERNAARAARDSERRRKVIEREQAQRQKQRLRLEKENLKTQQKQMAEAKKHASASKKLQEMELKQRERQKNADQKRAEVEQKKFLKEIKQQFNHDSIKTFKLGTSSYQPTQIKIDYTLSSEISLIADDKEDVAERIQAAPLLFDQFLWSGKFNSVIGPDGINGMKDFLSDLDIELSEKIALEVDEFIKLIYDSGIYYASDINRYENQLNWLTAFRELCQGDEEAFYEFFQEDTFELEFVNSISVEDLKLLKLYLQEFKSRFEVDLNEFVHNKTKIKLIA